jgi:hypothetical protein
MDELGLRVFHQGEERYHQAKKKAIGKWERYHHLPSNQKGNHLNFEVPSNQMETILMWQTDTGRCGRS